MLIRRLVIASLIAGAASAQADTIPASAAQPSTVVSSWTTGNGTDVLGSGVLQGNLNLVAGVAHSANASLSDILYGKVAGSVQQVDGQTKLFFQRGIEANYLLASGHGILAATAGPGKSVVGSADGAIITDGVAKQPGMTGGGNQTANLGASGNTGTGSSGSSGSTGTGTTVSGGGNSTPATTGSSTSGNTTTPSASQGSTSNGNNAGGNQGQGSDTGLGNGALNGKGDGIGTGKGEGLGNIANQVEAQAAEVPEPSSIALMLLGMMGAGAISRRRSR